MQKTQKSAVPAERPLYKGRLLERIAAKYHVDPDKMAATLKATCFKTGKNDPEVTNEQLMALLVVADQYNLNPFTREIFAFPDSQKGGITPIVSIDGWIRVINEHPQFKQLELVYPEVDDDEIFPWIEAHIWRKDRETPIIVREYFNECKRDTGPWRSHPRRMLRHKTIIQCGRVAFGFGGIYDPDEAERISDAIEGQSQEVRRKPATSEPRAIGQDLPEDVLMPQPAREGEPVRSLASEPNEEEDAGARG